MFKKDINDDQKFTARRAIETGDFAVRDEFRQELVFCLKDDPQRGQRPSGISEQMNRWGIEVSLYLRNVFHTRAAEA